MHRQGAQEIVECGIYPGMYFLDAALAEALAAEQFLLPFECQPVELGTSQRDDNLDRLAKRTGSGSGLLGVREQPLDASVEQFRVGRVQQNA